MFDNPRRNKHSADTVDGVGALLPLLALTAPLWSRSVYGSARLRALMCNAHPREA